MMRRVIQCAALLAVIAGSGVIVSEANACFFGGCCRRPRTCYQPVCYQAVYTAPAACCYDPCAQPVYAAYPGYYGAPVVAPVATYYAPEFVPTPYMVSYPPVGYVRTSRVRIRGHR